MLASSTHWQALCERAHPRATVRPGYPDLPLEARGPSDVGASASRRSIAALLTWGTFTHARGTAPPLYLRDAS